MTDQPNKPGAEKTSGAPEPAEQQPAVENQSTTTPDAYPDKGDARPDQG